MTISTACASSAKSFMQASQLIESGLCDAAVAGGADSLCGMTLLGFAALELVSPSLCRPCDAARSGLSLGEAAGFVLLERPEAASAAAAGMLLGCGATSDAYHMSAPDPRGAGAIGAMQQALAAAGLAPRAIDYINLHGTGTRTNDAMEDNAVSEVFGQATPCSSTKSWTGHTLGAAGIVEAVVSMLCLRHGLMPGCLGTTRIDPTFRSHVLIDNVEAPVRRVMSNSFGFGGSNCSLLFGDAA
jgi:3-oxoacyl-[acyl-carrier-protein] synthase-1